MEDEIVLDTIVWSAPEYNHREHSNDWYWSIGLISLISTILAIYFGNYIFSIFLILGGASLILFTLRHPKEVEFRIESNGITFGRDNHPWDSIKGFNIKRNMGEESYAKLLIMTDKHFLPVYTLPLKPEYIDSVRNNLLKVSKLNTSLQESPSMIFMEKLGF